MEPLKDMDAFESTEAYFWKGLRILVDKASSKEKEMAVRFEKIIQIIPEG